MRSSLAPQPSLQPSMPTVPMPTWRVPVAGVPLTGGALAARRLLSWRTTAGRRPNLLLEGARDSFAAAIRELSAGSEGPMRYCALPGRLELPSTPVGTLVLHDVAALTKSQQIALFDWLSTRAGDIQVISLTSVSLPSMVADGLFLEGLYYRLNVIRVDLGADPTTDSEEDWRSARAHVV